MFACYLFKKCVYILVKAKRQEVESLNEKHLITKLKKRSQKALDQLISSYSAYVYTIARNILGGAFTAEDAEEITSDVFSVSGRPPTALTRSGAFHLILQPAHETVP